MRLRPGVAIDLGTVNTLVYVAGRGLVVEEPSVVARERATGKVVAVGTTASAFWGMEPEGIEIFWPLRDGVIADFEASTVMLNAFLRRAHVHRGLLRPSALICVPRGANTVERHAVVSAVEEQHPHLVVHLVDEPLAASVGAGIGESRATGTFVVDVGGGTTDIAVVAGRGVVRARSLRVGGNAMDEAIAHDVRTELGLLLGHRAAERLKISLGLTGGESGSEEVVGVDVAQEELRSERIPGELVAGALEHATNVIVSGVHEVLSGTPPDLADEVVGGNIQLAGGGAMLLGLAERIGASTGIKTSVVDDPLRCVIRGAADILLHGDGLGAKRAKAA